ncbi:MAG: ankyrin repeat domain-containing protein, partial [Spirochaetes bacterium]|nr:ankyrin repeat domain-containing protein [Spirochaetota bacterium]
MKRSIFIIMFLFVLFSSYSANNESLNKALIKAAEKGNLDEVKKLIEKGADINASSSNFGSTPLSRALSGEDTPGKKEVYEFLIKSGADLKVINSNGSSLLH